MTNDSPPEPTLGLYRQVAVDVKITGVLVLPFIYPSRDGKRL